MCGIAGIQGLQNHTQVVRDELCKMVRQLHHRGPDGEGYFIENGIGLAHARLSIIDLKTGDQPIHNEDRSIWVIFNGEIFNYIELRDFLESHGHIFYTRTDTEVLVHLYEHYGHNFVQHLNGQFAIALWDTKQRKLILCRDRVGIVPLFYAKRNGRLLFASEIKALLPVLGGSPDMNPAALDQIMTFWSTHGDTTMFRDVFQLPPGEILISQDGDVNRKCYWDWEFPIDNHYHCSSIEVQADELRELLSDATRIRMRADVPIGAYLSGGLDSSVLASLMCQNGILPDTYSIRFSDIQLDEGSYQQRMVKHLGVRHYQAKFTHDDIGSEFPRAIWHTETPVLRTAPTPMMGLSRLVHSQGAKVVLTGEGADEVLGGYDIFKEAKIRRFWARNPKSLWRPLLLKRLYPYLEISPARSQSYSEAFFGSGLDHPNAALFAHSPRWRTTAQCKQFYSDDFKEKLTTDAISHLESGLPSTLPRWNAFNRAQYIEAKTLMSNYLLSSQGDRMLMANSVEGRFPFLDHRIIEHSSRMHPNLKMKVLREKYLLKRAMQGKLPPEILNRHKQPYRAPDIPAFFKNGVGLDYVEELLNENTIQRYGYFDATKVGLFLKKIKQGRAVGNRDNMALVGILSTQIWHNLYIDMSNSLSIGFRVTPSEK